MSTSLERRLRAAGVSDGLDPVDAWRQLRAVEGPAATIIDLYEIAASPRGLRANDLPTLERHELAREVMPDIWPDFDTTTGSDRQGDTIKIVDYDPEWPVRYEEWRHRLQTALGPTALLVEHVGSTSVPGMPAKPVIDIQISVSDLANEDAYVPFLEELGLQLRTRDAYHRYFRPFPGRLRDVHVHVCRRGSEWESEHLRFRDYLRRHPWARDRYAETKRTAAELWADDGFAYTDAKTEIVLWILEHASADLD